MGVVNDVVTDGECEPIRNEALAALAEIRVSRQRLGA
jgi:hypothetical protein